MGNNPISYRDPLGLDKEARRRSLLKHGTVYGFTNGAKVILHGYKVYDFNTGDFVCWIPEPGLETDWGMQFLMAAPFAALVDIGAAGALSGTVSRSLTEADLGVSGSIQELRGSLTVAEGQATIRIDMIQGTINNPFQIIKNLSDVARAHGASVLRIEGTLANERLFDALVRRYGMTSVGATDVITIPLR